jgi:hypothetical protein
VYSTLLLLLLLCCVRNKIPHATFTLLPLLEVVTMWCSIYSSSTLSTTKCMSIPYIRVCPSHTLYDLATLLSCPIRLLLHIGHLHASSPFVHPGTRRHFLSTNMCVVASCHVMCILRLFVPWCWVMSGLYRSFSSVFSSCKQSS